MELVVDANVLFAALVKQSKTAELLFRDDFHLYAPDYIFEEFEKHKSEILEKSSRTPAEFQRILAIFRRRIHLIPIEEIQPFLGKAKEISPDPGDVPYFAVALKFKADIWSNDDQIRKQNYVKIWKTHELAGVSS